jgi:carbamoyltransferase
MYILGINAFHGDSAACLVYGGEVVAAAEEERFRRIKHWAGVPTEAVRWCLSEAGISLADVGHIAVNQDATANLLRKITYVAANRPDASLLLDRIRNKKERAGIKEKLEHAFSEEIGCEMHSVEHHLAHLASAFLVSPFHEAVAVSVDGFGDFASAAWGVGKGNTLDLHDKVFFPHSLGIFYQALTQYLGFPHYGDEYKVMGLAPYGQPNYVEQLKDVLELQKRGTFRLNLDYFRHASEKVEYEWNNGEPIVGTLFTPRLEKLLGPARRKEEPIEQRHRDIARSTQVMYEDAFFSLLNAVHEKYPMPALALAGGCAMNSVANGKIYERTPFRSLYIQSAAGDAGGAIGSALFVWSQLRPDQRPKPLDHAYLGPRFSGQQVEREIEARRHEMADDRFEVRCSAGDNELVSDVAKWIADGAVVGWFQGAMEWGPRALGNRSILCDPRRGDMKDVLNSKIKRRESFRPFAPSILREATPDWFETDDDVPFMMQVYRIRQEKRALIPAVTHVDGTGRLQTVTSTANPRYYSLISAFAKITGVPMLLNTSFNENEPVVCKPNEALDCFLRTNMDALVMGDWIIRRKHG